MEFDPEKTTDLPQVTLCISNTPRLIPTLVSSKLSFVLWNRKEYLYKYFNYTLFCDDDINRAPSSKDTLI